MSPLLQVNVPLPDYVNFGPPFDDLDADIILRSSFASVPAPGEIEVVATDFLVHKLFLIKASTVFKSLLSSSFKTLDQQNAEALKHGIKCDIRGNLPILCLSEDRNTVHRLLAIIYHIDIVYPQTLETIKTLAAARKYSIPSVLAHLRTYCGHVAPFADTGNAFRAYVLVLNQGLKEEALEAAQLTLSLPQKLENYGSSLCNASGPVLHTLWKYRGMAVQAIECGVNLCLEEVGDFRDWKFNLPGDRDCCIIPTPCLREQFVLFTEKILHDFSTMDISNFADIMSPQGGFNCRSCKRQQHPDNARLFDCLERHVRGQIEQIHDELLSLFDDLGEAIEPQPSGGQPRNFGAPFDRGDSDITIRSHDLVCFQVHKGVLGIASAVFEDMFTAPGPSPCGQGEVKPVIDLTESSKTLLHLLSAIYPMDFIVPDTLEDALSLVSACQKYRMDYPITRIRASIRACTPPLFTAETSFRAYGIASRYHLEEEALHAAQLTLERSIEFDTLGEDLRFVSGADLFQLYEYRNECTKVAKDCIRKMINRKPIRISSPCPTSVFGRDAGMEPRWWHSHFLLRILDRPSPKTVTDRPAFQAAEKLHETSCRTCDSSWIKSDKNTKTLCAEFEAKLSEVIEQVRIRVDV